MTFAPRHIEKLKSNPNAMDLYQRLVKAGTKPQQAFIKAVTVVKDNPAAKAATIPRQKLAIPKSGVQEAYGNNAQAEAMTPRVEQ